MNCCITKKEKNSTNTALDSLQKYFDEITLEEFDKYTLITFKDKANKPNYDWVVWLSYKVQKDDYKSNEYAHCYRNAEYYMKEVCQNILDWIDCLKVSTKKEEPKQLSLFGEASNENELEELPPHPTTDGGWSKYHKECERIRKANKMKKYTFLELVNVKYYTYSGIDYRLELPSIEEVRELLKNAILKGMKKPGRYKDFWFDTPSYLTRDGALSNYELIDRLKSIRLFLLPYTSYPCVFSDDSFNGSISDKTISYRYYLDGTELTTNSNHDNDKLDLPTYEGLYNNELLEWVRKTMQISNKEVITDEEILMENIENYFKLEHLDFDMEKEINSAKNWKFFKSRFFDVIKENNYNTSGGGSGFGIDGYYCGYSDKGSKKGGIKITQELEVREEIGRKCKEINHYGKVIVYDLKGDELFKKAFELFSKKAMKQMTLFDLIA